VREMNNRALIIRGGGVLQGGEYDVPIKVFGGLKVNGDLIAKSLECAGSVVIDGDAEFSDNLVVRGSIVANDLVINGDCSINGGARIHGDLECSGDVEIHGGIRIEGDLKCSELRISGGIMIMGDISVNEDCVVNGGLKVEGDLEVKESLTIKLSGRGISEVKGEIKIGENLKVFSENEKSRFIVHDEVNVGNEAYLEYTEIRADLKARSVFLGRYAIVRGDIYYIDRVNLDPTAKVEGKLIRIASRDF